MSDDRELVERLAAVDATPRASWVAGLRADLDAAWETGDAGDLDWLRSATLTLVDHEPPPSEPSSGRRWPILAAAAAAVVAIALLTLRDHDPTPADQPSPTVQTTPAPRPMPNTPTREQLAPGTYFVDEVSGTPTPRIFATLGAGWSDRSTEDGWHISKRDDTGEIGTMSFDRAVAVFADACHVSDGFQPESVTTLDGLVAALSEQKGWAKVTAPSDISVNGYPGKALQRTAPADMSDCDTRRGRTRTSVGPDPVTFPDFRSWEGQGGSYYEPGEIETLWVLDLDGTMVVINTGVWPDPSAGARADFAADVLDSIRIGSALPADEPSPTVPPRALPDSIGPDQLLTPGTYFLDEVEGTPTPRIFFTIGAGWTDMPSGQVGHGSGFGSPAFSRPGAVFSDACHWDHGYYQGPLTTVDGLVTALSEQGGWADVSAPDEISIDGYLGKSFQRTVPADISGCDAMLWGPRLATQEQRGTLLPAFRSWQRQEGDWTPETAGNAAGFGYEPSMIETLWVVDIDGTVVVISSRPFPESSAADRAEIADVLHSIRIERLRPISATDTGVTPSTVDPLIAWSPELTPQALERPAACESSSVRHCVDLAVSSGGTLVVLDRAAGTLTWYEDEPRVVPLSAELRGSVDGAVLIAIGPHDIAYIASRREEYIVAVAPGGEEISRVTWRHWQDAPTYRKATGLVDTGITWLVPNGAPAMPWVNLDGKPMIDTVPYPTAKVTDAGIEVRLGERQWVLDQEAGTRLLPLDFRARSDGGVVVVLDRSNDNAPTINVIELSPDGSVGRYFVNQPPIVLPDGSLIVEHDFHLVRLIPPA